MDEPAVPDHLATFGLLIPIRLCIHRGAANLGQNPEAKRRPESHTIPVKGTVAALGVASVFGLLLATKVWATFWP